MKERGQVERGIEEYANVEFLLATAAAAAEGERAGLGLLNSLHDGGDLGHVLLELLLRDISLRKERRGEKEEMRSGGEGGEKKEEKKKWMERNEMK